MSTFRVGQKIVCVDDSLVSGVGGVRPPLVRGATYIVHGGIAERCCGVWVIDVGLPEPNMARVCGKCGVGNGSDGRWWVRADRFRPIEEADLTAELASSWKESVPVEQEIVNVPQPQVA